LHGKNATRETVLEDGGYLLFNKKWVTQPGEMTRDKKLPSFSSGLEAKVVLVVMSYVFWRRK